jgi:predicted transposase/invertase (TIGR01784 family)
LSDKTKVSEYLEVLFRYLFNSPGAFNKEELHEQVASILEEGGDIMQTIAQQLREEGIKIGEEKGKKEEKHETAKRMLLNNFSVEQVISVTGLTEKEVKSLMN